MLLLTVGCSENLKYENFRWSRLGSASSDSSGLDIQNLKLKIGKKEIHFEQQSILGVEVEDSYKKRIFDDEVKFVSSRWIKNIPITLRFKILYMKLQSHFVRDRIQKRYSNMTLNKLYEQPKLIIQDGELRWKMVLSHSNGELEGIFLDSNLDIKSSSLLGSRYGAEATIFPEGPLKSKLQDVLLQELA